jgi:xanthine dehydrogenase FAD-binding subunit
VVRCALASRRYNPLRSFDAGHNSGANPLRAFSYAAPGSVQEATRLLASANGGARILAGGTDILVQLREGLRQADLVVDVKKIPELMELAFDARQGLHLGASVPCYRLYESPDLVQAYPALTDAARIVGGWQIQSRASVGGNLCNSSPAADTVPPLIALKAICRIARPDGVREVRAEDFCTGPGRNLLEKGEMLVAMHLPAPAPMSGSAYERFIPRNEMAVVGAAAWVQLSAAGDRIEAARIAVGAVAPTPRLAVEAGDYLAGKPTSEQTFAEAGDLARKVAAPIDDMRGTIEFRTHIVGVLVKRILARAVARARGA